MQFVDIEGWNKEFGPPKDWNEEVDGKCETLRVLKFEHNQQISEGVHVTQPFLIIKIQPSDQDKLAIAEGAPLFLQIYGEGMPPVSLYTLDKNGLPNK